MGKAARKARAAALEKRTRGLELLADHAIPKSIDDLDAKQARALAKDSYEQVMAFVATQPGLFTSQASGDGRRMILTVQAITEKIPRRILRRRGVKRAVAFASQRQRENAERILHMNRADRRKHLGQRST